MKIARKRLEFLRETANSPIEPTKKEKLPSNPAQIRLTEEHPQEEGSSLSERN
jgi:hypothetical protein